MNFTINAGHAGADGTGPGRRGPLAWRPRAPRAGHHPRSRAGRPGTWVAAAAPALAATAALALAGPAAAGTQGAGRRDAVGAMAVQPGLTVHRVSAARPAGAVRPGGHLRPAAPHGRAGAVGRAAAGIGIGVGVQVLRLHPMPAGTVRFYRSHGRLFASAALTGLTPGSPHGVDLRLPSGRTIWFHRLTANAKGQAVAMLCSHYTGPLRPGSRLVIRMGTGRRGIAAEPIALTGPLSRHPGRPHRLMAVEAGPRSRGPLRGHAKIIYNPSRHRLTVIVSAAGLTPGPHAAHIHLGTCQSQGPVKYMLGDLMAGPGGRVVRAVRTFQHVMGPIPAHGWYLNIHQGSTATILRNGQPTIFFRPLLCANIR